MKKWIKYLILFLSGVVLAFGLYNIHSASNITEGGILGLSLLLDHFFNLSPSITNLILNILCYIFGWKIFGKEFIINSFFCGIGFSLSYKIFELTYPPLFPFIYDKSLLCALIVGVSIGISILLNGAPTGDDSLAMGLSKVIKIKIQWVYLIQDIIVLSLSLTYIEINRIIYSLLTVIISGQIIGVMQKFKKPSGKANNLKNPV